MKKLEDKNKRESKESFDARKEGIKSMFNNYKLFIDTDKAKQLVNEIQNVSFEAASFDCSEQEQLTEDAEFEVIKSKVPGLTLADIEKVHHCIIEWDKTTFCDIDNNKLFTLSEFENTIESYSALEREEFTKQLADRLEYKRPRHFIPGDPVDIPFDLNVDPKTCYTVLSPEEKSKLIIGNWNKR